MIPPLMSRERAQGLLHRELALPLAAAVNESHSLCPSCATRSWNQPTAIRQADSLWQSCAHSSGYPLSFP